EAAGGVLRKGRRDPSPIIGLNRVALGGEPSRAPEASEVAKGRNTGRVHQPKPALLGRDQSAELERQQREQQPGDPYTDGRGPGPSGAGERPLVHAPASPAACK